MAKFIVTVTEITVREITIDAADEADAKRQADVLADEGWSEVADADVRVIEIEDRVEGVRREGETIIA